MLADFDSVAINVTAEQLEKIAKMDINSEGLDENSDDNSLPTSKLVYNAVKKLGGGEVDQTYNPESENAQSGKAVEEAVSDKVTIYSGTEVSIANPGEGKVMTINKPSGSVTEPPLWNVKKGDLYLNEDENRLYLCVGSTKSGNILDLIWVGINYIEETSNKMDKFGEVLITEDEETKLKYTTLEVPDFFTINTDAILTLNGNMIDLNPTCGMIYCSGAVLTNMGEPQSGGDAATKNYVDNLAGDVTAALDEIISLQESIINGE